MAGWFCGEGQVNSTGTPVKLHVRDDLRQAEARLVIAGVETVDEHEDVAVGA